jgi:uncharacterized protein
MAENRDRSNALSKPEGGSVAHWFVAAWPGMGNVAVLSAAYLVQTMGLKTVGELAAASGGSAGTGSRFDIGAVEVKDGIVREPRMPRNLLYQTPEGRKGPKVTVFIGEAQPGFGSYAFAQELTARARAMGADRVVTFASMAAQLEPAQQPRVFGAATTRAMLDELQKHEVTPLGEGQIGGLNGVLLGAAAEQHVPAICLMGEIPFYAAGVPNPRAARGVLDAFGEMSGVPLDLSGLDSHIAAIDQVLVRLVRQLQSQGENDLNEEIEQSDAEIAASAADEPAARPARRRTEPADQLSAESKDQIERMFETAQRDRSTVSALKRELDRLGVFPHYENRFLDLFKRAE